MILFNPTNSLVSVIIMGDKLIIEPNDTTEVTEEQGSAWKKVHAFLQEQPEKVEVKKEKEVKEVEKEEVQVKSKKK